MRLPVSALAAALVLTGCEGQPETITVTKSWVRMPASANAPGAAYFTIEGGAADDRLIRVTAPTAIRSELHDTVREGGVVRMTSLDAVDVPAGGSVEFKPGGKHAMLFNLRPVKPGGVVRLEFAFASGYRTSADAPAQAPGTADPHAGH